MIATLDRQVPDHHQAAMDRLHTGRYRDAPHATAERLVNSAAIAAWALRPEELQAITLDQYTDLVMHACYPGALATALRWNADRRKIRDVIDHITHQIARTYP